ncbi:hypothetical protein [Mycobacteroides abscessus]|uniref:hypothetical protein n=1 Tax=Mycobacteroides abscessus TaxID=36809 RepID=UPI0002585136|nr:hypothetical protein [Mycobacteroides abscessus]EIC67168.1 hypothetical protein OUW_05528 [Mycobacteroides abscessus M93]
MATLEMAKLQIDHPMWLHAHGDVDRLTVYRSPGVRDTDPMYRPVQEFIAEHQMELVLRVEAPNDAMMLATTEASVWEHPLAHAH